MNLAILFYHRPVDSRRDFTLILRNRVLHRWKDWCPLWHMFATKHRRNSEATDLKKKHLAACWNAESRNVHAAYCRDNTSPQKKVESKHPSTRSSSIFTGCTQQHLKTGSRKINIILFEAWKSLSTLSLLGRIQLATGSVLESVNAIIPTFVFPKNLFNVFWSWRTWKHRQILSWQLV